MKPKISKELEKKIKILFYQIMSYGSNIGSTYTRITEDGDIDGDFVFVIENSHIDISEDIEDFLWDYARNYYQTHGVNSSVMNLDFVFNAKQKEINISGQEYIMDERYFSEEIDFDDFGKKYYEDLNDFIKKHEQEGEIEFDYDGSGDSGWIEFDNRYDNKLENALYEYMGDTFGNWGDNEGSRGKILINFRYKKILFEHNERFERDYTWDIEKINFDF